MRSFPRRRRNAAVSLSLLGCLGAAVVLSMPQPAGPAQARALASRRPVDPNARQLAHSTLLALRASGKVPAPPLREVYWGAYASGLPRPASIAALTRRAGRRPAIAMWYQDWSGGFPARAAERLARLGIVPMITWEPWHPPRVPGRPATNQPRYRLARITAGAFDRYLARYAREIKRYGGPVMLRPFHEMDGNWYPWGGTANGNHPRDFVPAWRHVHDLFTRLGVHNVTWVWSLNATSVPLSRDNGPREYWPGARYVDWIGISGFNFGTSRSFGSWVSFNTLFRARIAQLRRYHRPIAITEISSVEVGGHKAAWIRQTFAQLRGYPHLGALIWYDRKDAGLQDWRISSSRAAQAAFRRAVAARNIRSAPHALEAAAGRS